MSEPIVLFFRSSLPSHAFLTEDSFKESYRRLAIFAQERLIDLRFVLGLDQYTKGFFKSFWKYENTTYVHIKEAFKASIVHLRDRINGLDSEKRLNNPFLENVCRDKYSTALQFPHLVKKTLLISPDTISLIHELTTDRVVLKPRFGSDGTNVLVLPKEDIRAEMLSNDEYIAQEYIDSSQGVSDLISKRHEMRMYVMNGKLHSAYFRIPAAGSYLSNIAQGASVQLIDRTQIPSSAIALKEEIDKAFLSIWPRQYTIDIMFEFGKPWVVELNDTPGLPDVGVQPLTDNYLHALLDILIAK